MYEFEYLRPRSVDEASAMLREREEAKLLAGGMTLIPTLKLRLARPSALIDLAGIEALTGIRRTGGEVSIGAFTRHAEVAQSPVVREAIPALAALAGGIGDTQVRYRGTIGGSIANDDPAADYPAACLGLGATILTNRRQLPADEFFCGMFTTALEADEIVVAIRFPLPEKAAYIKFRNVASGYAIVGVMVSRGPAGTRVAVTGAGQDGVFRVDEMERQLCNVWRGDALRGTAISADGLSSDMHASAEYRAHLIAVLASRAVESTTGPR